MKNIRYDNQGTTEPIKDKDFETKWIGLITKIIELDEEYEKTKDTNLLYKLLEENNFLEDIEKENKIIEKMNKSPIEEMEGGKMNIKEEEIKLDDYYEIYITCSELYRYIIINILRISREILDVIYAGILEDKREEGNIKYWDIKRLLEIIGKMKKLGKGFEEEVKIRNKLCGKLNNNFKDIFEELCRSFEKIKYYHDIALTKIVLINERGISRNNLKDFISLYHILLINGGKIFIKLETSRKLNLKRKAIDIVRKANILVARNKEEEKMKKEEEKTKKEGEKINECISELLHKTHQELSEELGRTKVTTKDVYRDLDKENVNFLFKFQTSAYKSLLDSVSDLPNIKLINFLDGINSQLTEVQLVIDEKTREIKELEKKNEKNEEAKKKLENRISELKKKIGKTIKEEFVKISKEIEEFKKKLDETKENIKKNTEILGQKQKILEEKKRALQTRRQVFLKEKIRETTELLMITELTTKKQEQEQFKKHEEINDLKNKIRTYEEFGKIKEGELVRYREEKSMTNRKTNEVIQEVRKFLKQYQEEIDKIKDEIEKLIDEIKNLEEDETEITEYLRYLNDEDFKTLIKNEKENDEKEYQPLLMKMNELLDQIDDKKDEIAKKEYRLTSDKEKEEELKRMKDDSKKYMDIEKVEWEDIGHMTSALVRKNIYLRNYTEEAIERLERSLIEIGKKISVLTTKPRQTEKDEQEVKGLIRLEEIGNQKIRKIVSMDEKLKGDLELDEEEKKYLKMLIIVFMHVEFEDDQEIQKLKEEMEIKKSDWSSYAEFEDISKRIKDIEDFLTTKRREEFLFDSCNEQQLKSYEKESLKPKRFKQYAALTDDYIEPTTTLLDIKRTKGNLDPLERKFYLSKEKSESLHKPTFLTEKPIEITGGKIYRLEK